VRLDDVCEARLNNLCLTLGPSQSDVVKARFALLEQQSTGPAALAERLRLVGSFASVMPDIGTSSRGGDHAALLRQKLRDQHKQERQCHLAKHRSAGRLFDRRDQDHEACAGFFQPSVDEVCHRT